MNKSSKILFVILIILIVWSVIMTYNRTIIKKDFYTEKSEEEIVEEEITEPETVEVSE